MFAMILLFLLFLLILESFVKLWPFLLATSYARKSCTPYANAVTVSVY